MEALGIIPARGGSQRIPRKNMRELGGKPLLQWTVEAALESNLTKVVVSTEDPEIAALAVRLGVTVVPQPLESALSGTRSAPVVTAALDFMRDAYGYEPEYVCLLHPTSPFRSSVVINDALMICQQTSRSVFTVSGDAENGACYAAPAQLFRTFGSFFAGPMHALGISERAGIDIDTWEDLELARGCV